MTGKCSPSCRPGTDQSQAIHPQLSSGDKRNSLTEAIVKVERNNRTWRKEQQVYGRVADTHEIKNSRGVLIMGRGILLWLLGIPLPIVILLVLFMR